MDIKCLIIEWFGVGENRTDNYVVFNDCNYGMKFRHGKNLELKSRVEEHLNIEGWHKEILYSSQENEN